MEFRLTYEGPLMQGGGPDHKHEIRRVFHRQLQRLWEIHPLLNVWKQSGTGVHTTKDGVAYPPDPPSQSRLDQLASKFSRYGYRFVPIAIEDRGTIVSLNILLLRSGTPGSIMRSADLDGRLKTLVDTLRIPSQPHELGRYTTPGPDEDPFFGLMEDDKLVGNIGITTDTLLQPTRGSIGYHDTHDCRVIVGVTLQNYGSSPSFGTTWA